MGLALLEAVARRWRLRSGCCTSVPSASGAAAPGKPSRRFRPRLSPAAAAPAQLPSPSEVPWGPMAMTCVSEDSSSLLPCSCNVRMMPADLSVLCCRTLGCGAGKL